MSILGQIFGGAFAFLLIGTVGFIFWPADPCQRTTNAATVVYAVLGTIPLIGERALDRDMTRQWADVQSWAGWAQEKTMAYFDVTDCALAPMDLYGKRSQRDEASDWLRRNDPELYKLLESFDSSSEEAADGR